MDRPSTNSCKPNSRRTVVVLGMMSKRPWAGIVWITLQYLLGLQRLGYDVYYVEAHASMPLMFVRDDDGSREASAFIARMMDAVGLPGRWAFHALHSDGAVYGMPSQQLHRLYKRAPLLLNLHGGTIPLPEFAGSGRLVYVGTDPVHVEVEVQQGVDSTIDFLEQHDAFFTWGENQGRPSCRVPVSGRFDFKPTRQPIVIDLWATDGPPSSEAFTTVGSWRQAGKDVELDGEIYHWSKHLEFIKFLELPARTRRDFELALSGCDDADRQLLESHGWRVRDGLELSTGIHSYRRYITRSYAEFTVAKDQNVRLRSGWFSDRSASYLAAGRPVVTQETGFSEILPTGRGLFAFETYDEVAEAVEAIRSDYGRHSLAASELAREWFSHDVVLPALLASLGMPAGRSRSLAAATSPELLTSELDITPVSRQPVLLPTATLDRLSSATPDRAALARDVESSRVTASVVIATADNLPLLKLCLASLLANTDAPAWEAVVIDNGGGDGTGEYLRALAAAHPRIRPLFNRENRGFAAAMNQGVAASSGDTLVLLNDDTIVARGWLVRLARHLEDSSVGLVGAVTNRSGDEAEIPTSYRTYGEFAAFAAERAAESREPLRDVERLSMFCSALRREVYDRIGPLDEGFGLGLFEDDDYVRRVTACSLSVACAEDVFVHHFGSATIGKLAASGEYGRVFAANRRRFERKWQTTWTPRRRRANPAYERLREQVRATIREAVPSGATVLVTTKGDEELLRLEGLTARHFPAQDDSTYAGFHPADSASAIAALEHERTRGADYLVFPETAYWWLDHYAEFHKHLNDHYPTMDAVDGSCRIFALAAEAPIAGREGPGSPGRSFALRGEAGAP